MITDSKVFTHLSDSGLLGDAVLYSTINEVLNRPRHLDKVPKPISLHSVKNVEVCGCAKEFQILYNSNYVSDNDEVSHIELNGMNKDCDYVVYVALKSLILLGITKNEARAVASRNLFMSILQSGNSFISRADMYKAIQDVQEYYEKAISLSIISLCYTEEELVILSETYTPVNDKK